ncbi:hypothetical protein [Tenacibaculum finnmarkense]|uniref:hypothetical protein n=1 Tax=Tenacibaculum finnmarkense TaxID=2781243 RepID=UPI001EFAE767|nr:hypothetical protein [Tenacibaculum finnmarkense]MCG8208456.1 hypothetical protein [Tenacibaculum finnmarkense genomovar finnmarkense]MCG8724398.1 hypothetical protein [Tenacibaculum finnmarkense]MCG8742710.1 hypothetical protein [Tenacibaculum finnmarkense]MCG8766119.1 hypothetical protein [Tenacibaculum finnmarkense]MCG8779075.1 hypothetical protein [Tenacibaculum finnmarkense]
MKYLKIEDNRAFFINKSEPDNWIAIDKIEKDNLMDLLSLAIEEQDFEMDEYISENLKNKAHNIIYRHLFEKLEALKDNRDKIDEEAKSIYKEALEKY